MHDVVSTAAERMCCEIDSVVAESPKEESRKSSIGMEKSNFVAGAIVGIIVVALLWE